MQIRKEKKGDIGAISALTYAAFENHPHHVPGALPTEHLIVEQLRNQDALTLSLIAEDETGILAHVAFSPVRIQGQLNGWYGLGPVSVQPARQGQGIGRQLIEAGIKAMKALGAKGIVLLGEPAYYQRFGFQAQDSLVLPGVPAEYFLSLVLSSSSSTASDSAAYADAMPSGEVSYHSAFMSEG
ncbi:hypothetical protein VST7929_02169 [Vibrio stylophorae]|uniref:N-acetyltransferase domain-containing protein n=1 Tax=Vibrio stylophorae TaxID=659351 RepID=A0ABN8DZN6_9VIBR|nr:N-acetyltransferase [Vibrio stylophorae]CAH0534254.1 hypothetical protein VST7929_02169 [Vibrio stylophorae]